jgi:hypothetical protein
VPIPATALSKSLHMAADMSMLAAVRSKTWRRWDGITIVVLELGP